VTSKRAVGPSGGPFRFAYLKNVGISAIRAISSKLTQHIPQFSAIFTRYCHFSRVKTLYFTFVKNEVLKALP